MDRMPKLEPTFQFQNVAYQSCHIVETELTGSLTEVKGVVPQISAPMPNQDLDPASQLHNVAYQSCHIGETVLRDSLTEVKGDGSQISAPMPNLDLNLALTILCDREGGIDLNLEPQEEYQTSKEELKFQDIHYHHPIPYLALEGQKAASMCVRPPSDTPFRNNLAMTTNTPDESPGEDGEQMEVCS